MQKQKVPAPLTSCSASEGSCSVWTHIFGLLALAVLFGGLAGCTNRQVVPLNVLAEHPDKFVCKRADGSPEAEVKRPEVPPELVIVVSGDVANTTASVAAFMARLREREGAIARYVVAIEGVNFECWNNMVWQKDVYKDVPH